VPNRPLSKNFGDILSRQHDFSGKYPNLRMAARHLGQQLEQTGLEELWSCLDYYAKLSGSGGALGDTPAWLWPAVRELKYDALLFLTGRRCDRAAEALPVSTDYTLGNLFKSQVETGDVVISFNGDTIVERLAHKFGKRLRHCYGEPHDAIKFAKPHGSAAWPLYNLSPAVFDGEPIVESLAENMKNDPLMLGAVPIKSELLREVQMLRTPPGIIVYQVIMHQWRAILEAIRDADKLVVVGYSFPMEDQYGRFLFSEGRRLRTIKAIPRIEYYNINAESEASILDVFGDGAQRLSGKARSLAAAIVGLRIAQELEGFRVIVPAFVVLI
jgi:hypothetical protein